MAENGEDDECLSIGSENTDPDQEYVVDEILAVRKFHGELRYLVKWEDYDLSECTWEPRDSVQDLRAFDTWKVKNRQRKEGLLPVVDVEDITRQMLEGQARKQHRQQRRERLRARRVADVSSPSKKRKLDQRRQTIIIDDSGSEFERSASSSPSSSSGTSSAAPLSSRSGHPAEADLYGIAQARRLSQRVIDHVHSPVSKPHSSHDQEAPPDGDQVDTNVDVVPPTEPKKTKPTPQAPFIETSDEDDSLFGPGSPVEPRELVSYSPASGTSAQTSPASKPWVRVRRSGISMTTKPVDRQKNPKTSNNAQRADEWTISRRWTDQRHILQNNHKPDAESLATWDNTTGRFIPPQGSDMTRRIATDQHDLQETLPTAKPVIEQDRENDNVRNQLRPCFRPCSPERKFTCRRWLRNKECPFGDRCMFLHELTDVWEPKAGGICSFWANGRCKYVEVLCDRHHCHPDDRGKFPPISTPPIGSYSPELLRQLSAAARADMAKRVISLHQGDKINEEPSTATTAQATYHERLAFLEQRYGTMPGDRTLQTCRFWYREDCDREDQCEFAHEPRIFLAPKRGGRQVCRYWQKGWCSWSDTKCQYHHCKADANNEAINFKYQRTCKAWLDGHCSQSAEACDCYHAIWDPWLLEGTRNEQILLDDMGTCEANDNLFEPATISVIMVLGTDELVKSLPVNILLSDPSSVPAASIAYRVGKYFDDGNMHVHGQSGSPGKLVFQYTCSAADLSVCIGDHYSVSHQGSIVAVGSPDVLDALHSHLSDHDVGAVAHSDGLMVVVHSANDPTWTNFHSSATTVTNDKGLSLMAFDLNSLPKALQDSITGAHDFSRDIPASTLVTSTNGLSTGDMSTHGILGWDIANMLSSIEDKKDETKPDKKISKLAYLMFPLTLVAEVAALRLLLEHAGFEVYTPDVAGSWKYDFLARALGDGSTWKDAAGGVVIWHQTAYNYWEIARMHFTLHRSVVNHFIFEVLESGISDKQTLLSLTRIFPSGYAALMVDSIFIDEPHRALEIVKIITKDTSAAKQGLSYCLYVRPDILHFIHTLRLASMADKAKADVYMQLGRLLWKLENPNPFDIDGDTLMDIDGCKQLHSAITCPTNDELPDYCSRLAPHSVVATAALIEQFNLWTLSQVDRLRRFYVLVPEFNKDSPPRTLEEGELSQSLPGPTTSRTPPKGDRPARVPGDMTPKVRTWQEKYQHVFFRTTDKFIEKERKVDCKTSI